MPEPTEITIAKLRYRSNIEGSDFLRLYEKLIRSEALSDDDLTDALRFAVLFSRSGDEVVSRLGYRIILQYGEITRDYEPLHAIAQARDLMPIVAATERLNPALAEQDTLAQVLFAAHRTNFVTRDQSGEAVIRTRGQMELRAFNSREPEAVVVAPTSYGKSEMLVDKVVARLDGATCVIVPSRALIAQTRAMLVGDSRVRDSRIRIISHPDAYTAEMRFVAVMTQERLHRLFTEQPELVLDQLLVDEAHNLLPDDSRSIELSQVVLTARARNVSLAVTYYTPFISAPDNLRHVNNADVTAKSKTVNEHVKAERIVHAPLGGQQELYDQFLNRMISLDEEVPSGELSAVLALAGHRTLVYVNRPKDAQGLAIRLAQRTGETELSSQARRAITAIADLIDPSYSLIEAIQAGVLFHHGQVPDLLRQYIERLFREDDSTGKRLLVTTSTLLEGVNTPADSLVMMSPSRGRGHLSRSAFRNLIGRVARFREVFDPSQVNLDLLQPRIYLIPSSYARQDWNVHSFLTNVANLSKSLEDDVENPLLQASEQDNRRDTALEYLENIEPGASGLHAPRRAQTEVGRLCFRNGVHDFDIFENEAEIQRRVDAERLRHPLVDVSSVIGVVSKIFLEEIELIDSDDLIRVRNSERAQNFYSMFLNWRSQNEPYKRMIAHFLAYWKTLGNELVYVGNRWGEVPFGDGFRNLFVRMDSKTRAERINLAVVKIKEEQDFVDFRLVKYIEILNTLGLIDRDLYWRIKYGTSDEFLICLLKNGFSPELGRLVQDSYAEHVTIDIATSSVGVLPSLPEAMDGSGENDILVYEAQTLVNVDVLL
ncbi:DEAD/DEAH box helicase [Arthrobacter sp. H-02-3]|uniref:DEAD/DEAH box helicase n=1 Tax=Arthrobacter sp. H-02-3 TaxID=2703675 RepID=UPI000DD1BFFB|nr:DEAD/DEAH box helicase [Arthrobacter sp. H-02-3]PVZ53691.1 hypothetical protein C9424_17310 [Arthrobacter sp. H-02-3]